MKEKVAIVIPFYKYTLSDYELVSLRRCMEALSAYPIIAIKPLSLDLSSIFRTYPPSIVKNFDDSFFTSIRSYNRLMLSDTFYSEFLNYQYILIYQLDSFVFQDTLAEWCSGKYDYIGAPWLQEENNVSYLQKIQTTIAQQVSIFFNRKQSGEAYPSYNQFSNKVGNGGLSLRSVSKFHRLTIEKKETIAFYLSQNHYHYNEDAFWSIEVNRRNKRLKIPGYHKAVYFSFENEPEQAIQLTKGVLPFGCHDWDSHLGFWRPIFKQYGYTI